MARFETHSHSIYSNARLLDCINQVSDLVDRAISNGLSGIALTDHEILSGVPDLMTKADEIKEEYPDFKVAIGNEIYLTDTREPQQKYYHFILIAKDKTGYKMLKRLSTLAWLNLYTYKGLERVPTLKSELAYEINKFGKGHLIAQSACLGGELSTLAWQLIQEQEQGLLDYETKKKINDFILYCLDLFGEDFYIECAPGRSKQQLAVNKKLEQIAKVYNVKMVIGTDAHFLAKKDRFVHKAYLNSENGEREVDSFYEYSYLQTEDEIKENINLDYETLVKNSEEIYNKIERYSVWHSQQIPQVEVIDYPKKDELKQYPTLNFLYQSDNKHHRYWVNQCVDKLKEKDLFNELYLSRLEEEADTKKVIGEKLDTNMFSYPILLQHYIDMFWECGSTVGAGRGSSCAGLNHYLLGVTQCNPIKENFPWFRYMNKERTEIGDIDLDLTPSKRPLILKKICEERGKNFNPDIEDIYRKNLGCAFVATFGTEKSKSSIQTACRGYRSKDYPQGIPVEESLYLSSLIPEERGFNWSLKDVAYGNEEKGRKPVKTFLNYIKSYPDLLEIALKIENLVKQRGIHASGVILFDEDPFEYCAFMRAPSGEITTQFDLHSAEKMGMTKIDLLVTDVQDEIVQTIAFLQKDGVIESDLTLREAYDKYLHPDVLPLSDNKIWDSIDTGAVFNIFQFNSIVGINGINKLQPRSLDELTATNGLIRLMTGEKGEEQPIDKYYRFKQNPQDWIKEMRECGLTSAEMETFKRYLFETYGVGISQEQMMLALMDSDICGFSLADANMARKIVGKKQMEKIPQLREKIASSAKSEAVGRYVWLAIAAPQLGYSFSTIHSRAYSYIGVQTAMLGSYFNPVYWNTSCLIVNSGSLTQDGSSTNYAKVAKALGATLQAGISVSLVDINHSEFSFIPDAANNQILFGMKSLLGISDDIINTIIANRPYSSPRDFLQRVKPDKTQMISLIKAGAFDSMLDRKLCMAWYVWETCGTKRKLTLQNLPSLIKYGLIPEEYRLEVRIFNFNKYLKAITKADPAKYEGMYTLDARAIEFLHELKLDDMMETDNLAWFIKAKVWDKQYKAFMENLRPCLNQETLDRLNDAIFLEEWNKYAQGNISAWEMEVMGFYYHEHELAHLDNKKYGIRNYFSLPEEPEVDRVLTKGDVQIKTYKLSKIAGTVIAKEKNKGLLYLLTTSGVVTVRMPKELMANYDRRISRMLPDGTKEILEDSWLTKGNKLIISGHRKGEQFVCKNYKSQGGHHIYRINEVLPNGEIVIQIERAQDD